MASRHAVIQRPSPAGRAVITTFKSSACPQPDAAAAAGAIRRDLQDEIKALRRALAVERLVGSDLAQRNSNLLAVASGLVRRALEESEDLDRARAALANLTARLQAAHSPEGRDAPREMVDLASDALASFEIEPQRRVSMSGPRVCLAADAARMLTLALFELATNAVKYGALGRPGGAVTLAWGREALGLRLVWQERFAVDPDGAVIAPTGGLMLMRRIGEALDGAITFDPRPGGLRAEIVLGDRHLAPGPAARVLIVEDSPLIAMDIADMLEKQGLGAATLATSVAEARAALASSAFDLALLDVSLGDGSSDALLPDLGAAVVIVVSGHAAEDLPPAFLGLPLLPKPFQPANLAAALKRLGPFALR